MTHRRWRRSPPPGSRARRRRSRPRRSSSADGWRRGSASRRSGSSCTAAAGPAAFEPHATSWAFDVFADLKLHDIPTTVGARRARARPPRRRLTSTSTPPVASRCCAAGVEGLREGASDAWRTTRRSRSRSRCSRAIPTPARSTSGSTSRSRAGCDGVVCSAHEARPGAAQRVRTSSRSCPASGSRVATPHDQARVATPPSAVAAPAPTVLVIGRTVTAARRSRSRGRDDHASRSSPLLEAPRSLTAATRPALQAAASCVPST